MIRRWTRKRDRMGVSAPSQLDQSPPEQSRTRSTRAPTATDPALPPCLSTRCLPWASHPGGLSRHFHGCLLFYSLPAPPGGAGGEGQLPIWPRLHPRPKPGGRCSLRPCPALYMGCWGKEQPPPRPVLPKFPPPLKPALTHWVLEPLIPLPTGVQREPGRLPSYPRLTSSSWFGLGVRTTGSRCLPLKTAWGLQMWVPASGSCSCLCSRRDQAARPHQGTFLAWPPGSH